MVHNRGTAFFVTTCTGNNFQIYDCDKLGLLFVSPQTELPISALAADGDLTYAATGKDILVFKRAKLVCFPPPPQIVNLAADPKVFLPGFV